MPKIKPSTPGRDVLALFREGVHVGQRELARIHLLLDLGSGLFTEDGLERIAGDDGQSGIPVRWLLSRLHDDACRLQFDQGVVRLGSVLWNVDDQAWRALVAH